MQLEPIRVLLIYPPSKIQTHTNCPLGLLMLAAVLEKAGHIVFVLDANAVNKRRSIQDIVDYALKIKPDVIGITLLTPLIREAYKLSSVLKNKGFKLIAGGPHASIVPEECLKYGFDAVVAGEGEDIIEEAVQTLHEHGSRHKVQGWVFEDSYGKIVKTPKRNLIHDLDTLPYPSRHLVELSDYEIRKKNDHTLHSSLFSSRGCSARCTFCSGHLFGKKFRFRSAQNILDEIVDLHTTYDTRHFHFVDDAMSANKDRLIEFCQRLVKLKLNITWTMMTRVDRVDGFLLERVADAGCVQIEYGVESGHPETLKKIHKPHTVEQVRYIIPLTAKMGIKPYAFFILGFPWETVSNLDETHRLIVELSPYVDHFHPAIASILVPFPGTEIYEVYKNGYDLENWWLRDDKQISVPSPGRHAYYETKLFPLGMVLEADFFQYSTDVKRKIYEIFTHMYFHNQKKQHWLSRSIRKNIFQLSRKFHDLSPAVEHSLFYSIHKFASLKNSMSSFVFR